MAYLEHPFKTRGRVFGASAVQAVGKEKNNAALLQPLRWEYNTVRV